MKHPLFLGLVLSCLLAPVGRSADNDGKHFFETKIRPVLVDKCYSCHSVKARDAKKLKGQLYLDSAAGIAAGGESGAVLVKGKSKESLLMKALRFDGMEMPPSGKLPETVIDDFAKWIDMDAPDPRTVDAVEKPKREISIDEGKKWWAFQPLRPVPPANTKTIDQYIHEAQKAKGLTANKPAGREKLIRRVYFDLIGLPPSEEQVAAFVRDTSPTAFEKVVDELLASPGYGERWGRHWLDVARFAESGGYEFDGFRPGAYHYRDWVIRALNADMPYTQFVRMQLAGDVLEPDDIEGAAATGFLVAGPYPGQITAKTVERIRYDQLDDMLMTIGGSMLGLTLGCVRCHEHKYDPIPQQDYYALAAALAKTVHGPRTLDLDPTVTRQALTKHAADHAPLVATLKAFAAKDLPARFDAWRKTELAKQPDTPRWQSLEPVTFVADRAFLKELPTGILAFDGTTSPAQRRQRGQRPVGTDEHYRLTFHTHQKNLTSLRLDTLTEKSLPQRGPGLNPDGGFQLAEVIVTARPLHPQANEAAMVVKLKPVSAAFADEGQPLANAVDGKPGTVWMVRATAKKDNAAIFDFERPIPGFANGTELFVELKFREMGLGRLRVSVSTEPAPATWAGDTAPQHVAELRAIAAAHGAKMPSNVLESLARWLAPFDAETAKVFHAVRDHAAAAPRPKLVEVYTTINGGQDVFFLRRGEVDAKNGKAEPGIVQVLHRGPPKKLDVATDARVALADWMTDVDYGAGPLLARVIANRIWQHHFGDGLVGTPNDFGVQGEKPTHPELLEHLAAELVRGGWKLKALHKTILLSAAYRQSHEITEANRKLDPDNLYLWHFKPRRLEAETIRDSLLAIGGNLDAKLYGPSVLDNSTRRSVYLRVKRSELIPIMTLFDAPEPTQSIGERVVTTVPTQALALMNSPFVRQQAEKFAARINPTKSVDVDAAIDRGYRAAYGRAPTEGERTKMRTFIDQQRTATGGATAAATHAAIVEFCHVLFCLNEFVYVD
ncbi:MAG: PSD1 domain-containing protein [Planctomycetia bacterium]|nr:PSD1 domain-containing protein [Planctomycetia bacterium]